MRTKQEIGKSFEKEAFKILKNNFKRVIWLSKKNRKSIFDFKCLDENNVWVNVEAKSSTKFKKVMLKLKQQNADYVIFKNSEGKIVLIKKEDFSKFLFLEKERELIRRPNWMIGKRIREIILYGNSYAIKLDPSDIKDFGLVIGDKVDIDDLNLLECKNKEGKE